MLGSGEGSQPSWSECFHSTQWVGQTVNSEVYVWMQKDLYTTLVQGFETKFWTLDPCLILGMGHNSHMHSQLATQLLFPSSLQYLEMSPSSSSTGTCTREWKPSAGLAVAAGAILDVHYAPAKLEGFLKMEQLPAERLDEMWGGNWHLLHHKKGMLTIVAASSAKAATNRKDAEVRHVTGATRDVDLDVDVAGQKAEGIGHGELKGSVSADSPSVDASPDHHTSKDSANEETVIKMIKGHKWVGKGLQFEVLWDDGDVTWEKQSNIEDCAALDEYLVFHKVADPLLLSKTRFVQQI
ncbi:hypothetical protein BT96DRAFT_944275 [Gymnopus androsaceus JB14]|uniref:Chromo domain-containing protein n=1 Tax=Gymnopus androsaceus JB14 TaxID=1447944 RepID=A0A6A4H6X8_9AGAR|nr:hypothetical protein BT96DRAFT_944275 [Gymnopus androsaceus JB14]